MLRTISEYYGMLSFQDTLAYKYARTLVNLDVTSKRRWNFFNSEHGYSPHDFNGEHRCYLHNLNLEG